MTFAQQRNRLTTHFSESIPVVKRSMTVIKQREKFYTYQGKVQEDVNLISQRNE